MKKIILTTLMILSLIVLVSALSYDYFEEIGYETDQYLEISKQDINKINQINKAIDRTIKKDRVNDYLFRKCDEFNLDNDFACDEEITEIKQIIGETELFNRDWKTYLKLEFEVKTNQKDGVELIYLVINFNNYEEYYILDEISKLENIPYRI